MTYIFSSSSDIQVYEHISILSELYFPIFSAKMPPSFQNLFLSEHNLTPVTWSDNRGSNVSLGISKLVVRTCKCDLYRFY